MKVYYNEFNLKPVMAINALEQKELRSSALENSKDLSGETSQNDFAIVKGIIFKCVHQRKDLYTSYTFHEKIENQSFDAFLNGLKVELPSSVISNLSEEHQLKKIKFSLSESLKPSSDGKNENLERSLSNDSTDCINSKSHYTVNSLNSVKESLEKVKEKVKVGFKRFKFKVNNNSLAEISEYFQYLENKLGIEFIFDFNGTADLNNLLNLKINKDILKRIYWEDPTRYNFKDWNALDNLGFQLILDNKLDLMLDPNIHDYPFKIIGLKPTKESVLDALRIFPNFKYLITTNMGDELDHRISLYWANKIFKEFPDKFFGAGINTRHFFNNWIESNNLNEHQESNGWGLDFVMESKSWTFLGDYSFEF